MLTLERIIYGVLFWLVLGLACCVGRMVYIKAQEPLAKIDHLENQLIETKIEKSKLRAENKKLLVYNSELSTKINKIVIQPKPIQCE